ncbi:MAG TPA: 2-oxo acid dehydrogenase subunit E2 [Bryobacteraceae bacterium]
MSAPIRKLTYAERWLHDGLLISNQPAFHQSIEIDIGRVKASIQAARERGFRCTYTHALVRAAALALSANPELHRMLAGNRMQEPSRVDIALSVSGEGSVVPTLVIQGANEKPIDLIAGEIVRRLPEAQEADRQMRSMLNTWGWLVPFGFLRRAVLRLLFRSFRFRQKGAGTFQVSVVPGVDQSATPLFNAAAILVAGEVKDRAIAVNGLPAVRPTIRLTCSADHRLWNGHDCQKFLVAVGDILTGVELEQEILEKCARRETLEGAGLASDAFRNH